MALSTYGRRPIAAFGSGSLHRTFGPMRRAVCPSGVPSQEVSLSRKPKRGSGTLFPQVTTYQRGY